MLEDPAVTVEKRQLRAVALQIMGEAFSSVKKDTEEQQEEAEYVRVDTRASKEREKTG